MQKKPMYYDVNIGESRSPVRDQNEGTERVGMSGYVLGSLENETKRGIMPSRVFVSKQFQPPQMEPKNTFPGYFGNAGKGK